MVAPISTSTVVARKSTSVPTPPATATAATAWAEWNLQHAATGPPDKIQPRYVESEVVFGRTPLVTAAGALGTTGCTPAHRSDLRDAECKLEVEGDQDDSRSLDTPSPDWQWESPASSAADDGWWYFGAVKKFFPKAGNGFFHCDGIPCHFQGDVFFNHRASPPSCCSEGMEAWFHIFSDHQGQSEACDVTWLQDGTSWRHTGDEKSDSRSQWQGQSLEASALLRSEWHQDHGWSKVAWSMRTNQSS
ncbi:unnamed protein product [Polarella glacialis]|uniref:Uncharacterized protein n=1 Tax=Polarella glacialis TaxID=89957 RepID=A0A813GHM0_POLGL|nr:unnamed protein product [Polarella glacialis]